MEFIVRRTSNFGDERPCKNAFQKTLTPIDERAVSSPEKLGWKLSSEWFSMGTNHRVENKRIRRDMGCRPFWFVTINGLDGMLKFIKKNGEIIVSFNHNAYLFVEGYFPSIEIYDTYRE